MSKRSMSGRKNICEVDTKLIQRHQHLREVVNEASRAMGSLHSSVLVEEEQLRVRLNRIFDTHARATGTYPNLIPPPNVARIALIDEDR